MSCIAILATVRMPGGHAACTPISEADLKAGVAKAGVRNSQRRLEYFRVRRKCYRPFAAICESGLVCHVLCFTPNKRGGCHMAYDFTLGELICCLYDEYSAIYEDDELAALAADVALNDLLMRFDVHELADGSDDSDDNWYVGFVS